MRQVAERAGPKLVTQMGNQGSAENRLRRAVELVWGGVIGEVREAHVWFDGGNGPMKRPTVALRSGRSSVNNESTFASTR